MKRAELQKIQNDSIDRLVEGRAAVIRFGAGIGLFLASIYAYLVCDLGDNRRLRSASQALKNRDSATGLFNSKYLIRALRTHISHAARDKNTFALMLISFNPSHLSDEHDDSHLSILVARTLVNIIPMPHDLARIQDAVFGLLIHSFRDNDELGRMAMKICDVMALELSLAVPDRRGDINIGIAIYPDDATNVNALFARAKVAMSRPAARRKGRYEYYDQRNSDRIPRDEVLAKGLYDTISADGFKIAYQPQIQLSTNEIVGVEALLRWEHPSLGPISPDEFIPIAERTGLILPIGLSILHTACGHAAEWNQHQTVRVAINVCTLQLRDPNFLGNIKAVLKQSGLHPAYLEIELTERVMMDPMVTDLLSEIRKIGVKISIDDFGTGYSSFSYLSRFPTDAIKIDRSFIRSTPMSTKDNSVVRTIIHAGRELGIMTIAEGIETEEQSRFLLDEGCDLGQGYFFYRPMTPEQFESLLSTMKVS